MANPNLVRFLVRILSTVGRSLFHAYKGVIKDNIKKAASGAYNS